MISTSSLPQLSIVHDAKSTTIEVEPMTVLVGKQLIDNYRMEGNFGGRKIWRIVC